MFLFHFAFTLSIFSQKEDEEDNEVFEELKKFFKVEKTINKSLTPKIARSGARSDLPDPNAPYTDEGKMYLALMLAMRYYLQYVDFCYF